MTDSEFDRANVRRIELAKKKSRGELNGPEVGEFDRLQAECFAYLNAKFPGPATDIDRLNAIEVRFKAMADGRRFAPFTPEEVVNLNEYQETGCFHPFTCGTDSCRATLVATEAGWTCPACEYTQGWAHGFMSDGSWREHAAQTRKWMGESTP